MAPPDVPSDDGDARARDRAEHLVGRTIDGRYRIDGVLAMGGMGAVYVGRHLKLKKRVALKVLHPAAEDDPELVSRFEREALAGGHVSHPHVAAATDFGELADGTRFLVMEYVKGITLRSLVEREGALPAERAARIARQIAVALGEIHGRGIVHRDLKPRNVMLTEDDFVKIVDFGLAKVEAGRMSTVTAEEEADDARLTTAGVVFGTFGHLAPEAALGMASVDARSDLYALGVMLYEMLAGKHPFEAKTDLELFARQRTRRAPPIAERAPGVVVPEALERVALRLLERDPGDRFQSAADLMAAIDAAEPSASQVPLPPPESLVLSNRPGPPDEVVDAVRKMWGPLADTASRSMLRPRAETAPSAIVPARAPPPTAFPSQAPTPLLRPRAPEPAPAPRRTGMLLALLLLVLVGLLIAGTCGAGPATVAAPPGARPAARR